MNPVVNSVFVTVNELSLNWFLKHFIVQVLLLPKPLRACCRDDRHYRKNMFQNCMTMCNFLALWMDKELYDSRHEAFCSILGFPVWQAGPAALVILTVGLLRPTVDEPCLQISWIGRSLHIENM